MTKGKNITSALKMLRLRDIYKMKDLELRALFALANISFKEEVTDRLRRLTATLIYYNYRHIDFIDALLVKDPSFNLVYLYSEDLLGDFRKYRFEFLRNNSYRITTLDLSANNIG